MTFEQFLYQIANVAAGIVAGWIQDAFDVAVSARLVAIVLSILAAGAVYALTFVAGFPIFGDVTTPQALWQIFLGWLLAFTTGQARYAMLKKYEHR